MTTLFFMEELKEKLEAGVKDCIGLINKKEKIKVPEVYLHYLPFKTPKRPQEKDDYPYVLIRFKKSKEVYEKNEVKFQLILGVYRDDESGIVDLLHLYELIRRCLIVPGIFSQATLEHPIEFEIPEEQGVPQFIGIIELSFNLITYTPEIGCDEY